VKTLLIVLAAALLGQTALAATFRVERDGSAPYTIIQDAVDAAASGDTILIGPGRYNEGRVYSPPGWTALVRVLVHQAELTIIGSGPQSTIIGQVEPYQFSQGSHWGIEATRGLGNTTRVIVSGIRFENMRFGVTGAFSTSNMIVLDCVFSGLYYGILTAAADLLDVRSCSFEHPGANGSGYFVFATSCGTVNIDGCTFSDLDGSLYRGYGASIQQALVSNVTNCDFVGGDFGLHYAGGVNGGSVRNCNFVGQSMWGLGFSGIDLKVDGCTFSQQRIAIDQWYGTYLVITNTEILDVSEIGIRIGPGGDLKIANSYLAHGPQYAIADTPYCSDKGASLLPVLDLRNNNWGTTNADSIASWIGLCNYDTIFIPFIGQPVPSEPVSFGSLKASFR